LPVSAEFLCFRGIWHWPVIRGHISVGSGGHRKLITVCMHDFTIKYTTATWALIGVLLKNIDLKYCPVYLADRMYPSVAVASDKYCIFGRELLGPYKINYDMWKICSGEPRNLANWPAKFGKICGRKPWFLLCSGKMQVP